MTEFKLNDTNNSEPGGLKKKNIKKVTALVLLLVVLIAIIFALSEVVLSSRVAADPDMNQAVFLDNGEVYFGNVVSHDDDYLVLENIYYLQVNNQTADPQNLTTQNQPQINLVKLGEELHGPQDKMFIPLHSIVYWENLEADGQVSQAITAAESGNQQQGVAPLNQVPPATAPNQVNQAPNLQEPTTPENQPDDSGSVEESVTE